MSFISIEGFINRSLDIYPKTQVLRKYQSTLPSFIRKMKLQQAVSQKINWEYL